MDEKWIEPLRVLVEKFKEQDQWYHESLKDERPIQAEATIATAEALMAVLEKALEG